MESNAGNGNNLALESEKESITHPPDSIILKQNFPEEIWEMVTDNLVRRKSDHLESVANSSPFFYKQLAPYRSTYLFEKAFQFVPLPLWKKEGLKGFPVKDVLKLRGTCSHWNVAVDKLICEKFQYIPTNFGIVTFQASVDEAFQKVLRNEFVFPRLGLGRTLAVEKFIEYFQDTHPLKGRSVERSPFIGTKLSIRYPIITVADEEYQRRYLAGISAVLLKYGSYIQHLTLNIDNNVQYFANVQWVRQSLSRLPHLRKLQIVCDDTGHMPRDIESNAGNLFPKWKKFEVLVTSRVPGPIFYHLIRMNNHVSTLIVNRWETNCDFFTFSLRYLTHLEIETDSVEFIEKLGYPDVQWPLKYLKIDFGCSVYKNCPALFQVIQDKFASTLQCLNLSVNKNNIENEDLTWESEENGRLDLPKLKKIELYVNGAPVCLDFLLPMRNYLEEIKVTEGYKFPLTESVTATSGDVIQFSGYEWKMMESNIWAIFKKLNKIEVVTNMDTIGKPRFYFRKDWVKNNFYNYG